jgi:hypothetical protein
MNELATIDDFSSGTFLINRQIQPIARWPSKGISGISKMIKMIFLNKVITTHFDNLFSDDYYDFTRSCP